MTTTAANRSVLLVGNFLSGQIGNHCVCEDLAKNLEAAGLGVITTSKYMARLPRVFDMVSTILRRRRDYSVANVDVYSGAAFGWAEACSWALRISRRPYVLTLHGGNLPVFGKRWPKRMRRLLQGAQVVTTPSSYLMEQMRPYRSDIQLIPNPLNLDNYPYRLRRTVSPKLVWVRSFHQIYNAPLAARIVAELKTEFPDVQLTMVGPDKGDGSLQETQRVANELDVADRIEFVGGVPKDQIPHYLNRGDIFLNTTNTDNTPVSVLEAMACGLCVVSTDVGGIPYLVTDNTNGLLVKPDDSVGMSDAVRRVLCESDLAGTLSANAKLHASQFDWQAILPKWVELFTELDPSN